MSSPLLRHEYLYRSSSTAPQVIERSPVTPQPPSPWLLLGEFRALGEYFLYRALMRALQASKRGDGHPVLLIPGLMSSDWAMAPMHRLLSHLGYTPYGWGLGVNQGPREGVEAGLRDRLKQIANQHGRKVSLVGTSLGGIYARQLAKALPRHCRSVITLGSPFSGHPRATRAWRLYEYVSGHRIEDCDRHIGGALAIPPNLPTTAIYSRSDGICAWQCCIEQSGPMAESVAVPSSHLGLPHNPLAMHVVADRLAQSEGQFHHFPAMNAVTLFKRILGEPGSCLTAGAVSQLSGGSEVGQRGVGLAASVKPNAAKPTRWCERW
jgi:pimeloyl-ACP methyl ester carboxylesterase